MMGVDRDRMRKTSSMLSCRRMDGVLPLCILVCILPFVQYAPLLSVCAAACSSSITTVTLPRPCSPSDMVTVGADLQFSADMIAVCDGAVYAMIRNASSPDDPKVAVKTLLTGGYCAADSNQLHTFALCIEGIAVATARLMIGGVVYQNRTDLDSALLPCTRMDSQISLTSDENSNGTFIICSSGALSWSNGSHTASLIVTPAINSTATLCFTQNVVSDAASRSAFIACIPQAPGSSSPIAATISKISGVAPNFVVTPLTNITSVMCGLLQSLGSVDPKGRLLLLVCSTGVVAVDLRGNAPFVVFESMQAENSVIYGSRGELYISSSSVTSGGIFLVHNVTASATAIQLTTVSASSLSWYQPDFGRLLSSTNGFGVVLTNTLTGAVTTLASELQCSSSMFVLAGTTDEIWVFSTYSGFQVIIGNTETEVASTTLCSSPGANGGVVGAPLDGTFFSCDPSGVLAVTSGVASVVNTTICGSASVTVLLDPRSGAALFAFCSSWDGAILFRLSDHEIVPLPCRFPTDIAIASDREAYAACSNQGSINAIMRFDPSDWNSTATVALDFGFCSSCCNPSMPFGPDPLLVFHEGAVLTSCFYNLLAVNVSGNGAITVLVNTSSPAFGCQVTQLWPVVGTKVIFPCSQPGGGPSTLMQVNQNGNVQVLPPAAAVIAACIMQPSFVEDQVRSVLYMACSGVGGVFAMQNDEGLPISSRNLTTVVSPQQCVSPTSLAFDPASASLFVACQVESQPTSNLVPSILRVSGSTIVTLAAGNQCTQPLSLSWEPEANLLLAGCTLQGVVAISQDFKCMAGYQWSAGECELCGAGTYRGVSMLNDSLICLPCSTGRYMNQPGASACTACGQGTYQAAAGATTCTRCSPGRFSNATGSALPCETCSIGKYQSADGQSDCLACSPPYFAMNTSATICSLVVCAPNQEYRGDPQGRCDYCPLGSFSLPGSPCTTCPVSTYTPQLGADCVTCTQDGMDGLSCANGIASVDPDYWAERDMLDGSTGMLLFSTYQCPSGFCMGGVLQDSGALNASFSASIQYCVFPRQNSADNVLCGECAEGYLPWGDTCDKCTGVNVGIVFAAIILSYAIVLWLLRSSVGSSAGATVVLVYFVQTASLEMGSSNHYLSWLKVSNFGAGSTSTCIAPLTPYQQTLLTLLTPIILILQMSTIALLHLALHRRAKRQETKQEVGEPEVDAAGTRSRRAAGRLNAAFQLWVQDFSWSKYIGCGLSILSFSYTSVSVSCVQYFYCVSVGSRRVVFNSPTMDCSSPEYYTYLLPVVIVFVTIVVGFPIGILIFLLTRRHKMQAVLRQTATSTMDEMMDGKREELSDSNRQQVAPHHVSLFLQRFGPLFAMFRAGAWYWQSQLLLRRTCFVLVAALLVRQPGEKFVAFGMLNLACLQLHAYVRPMQSSDSNTAETWSHAVLLSLSLLLAPHTPPYPMWVQICAVSLVLPTAAGLTVWAVREQWAAIKRKGQKVDENRAKPEALGEEANGAEHTPQHSSDRSAAHSPVENINARLEHAYSNIADVDECMDESAASSHRDVAEVRADVHAMAAMRAKKSPLPLSQVSPLLGTQSGYNSTHLLEN
jgi:hypothetical protein